MIDRRLSLTADSVRVILHIIQLGIIWKKEKEDHEEIRFSIIDQRSRFGPIHWLYSQRHRWQTIVVGQPNASWRDFGSCGRVLKEEGYTLEVKEFTDYVQPNLTLETKSWMPTFFQHLPYLEDFNVKNNTKLVSAGVVHYEPLGLYPGKIKTLDAIANGATIAIPNDTTGWSPGAAIAGNVGLIKVDPKAGLEATPKDVIENPKNIVFKELEAAQS